MHGRALPPSARRETPTADELRRRFDATEPFTVGLEEEILLVAVDGPGTVPFAEEVVRRAARPTLVKEELPSCQVELVTRPHRQVADAAAELASARRLLAHACDGIARPAAAAVHPLCARFDGTSTSPRYRGMIDRFGRVAEQQLVGSLQVHVGLGDHRLALPAYNLLREHLPVLAAIAAAAPFHDGRDTGMASVRPLLCGQLPRQGIPPILRSWDHYAHELAWGVASGTVEDATQWWWELRPHPRTGTLEVRVLDVQPTVGAGRTLASLTVATVKMVAAQVAAGSAPEPVDSWRIEENRWSALRHGMDGTMADVRTGDVRPTREVAQRLLRDTAPYGEPALLGAHAMVDRNAASALREVGLDSSVSWLCEVFSTAI